MRLYSYVLTHDTGFAPNPFQEYCTLANCKPAIRRTAQVGDWVVGLSPKASGNKIIYAMKIDEILSYEQYFTDNRFQPKEPAMNVVPIYISLPMEGFINCLAICTTPKIWSTI